MANGIIIHVEVGAEKRTEFFLDERIRIGVDESSDLQIRSAQVEEKGIWLELESDGKSYRLIKFNEKLDFLLNDGEIHRFREIVDGDVISIQNTSVRFSFFSLASKSALITTKREPHTVPFIEHAAMEAGTTTKRDDAKVFLREFFRELFREISLTTKIIITTLLIGILSGTFYLGISMYKELQKNRLQAQEQNEVIKKLEEKLTSTSDQITNLDKTNQDIIKTVSLTPNIRIQYGGGVCLISGTYALVDRKSGKTLRYPDPNAYVPDPYEPTEEGFTQAPPQQGLTTEGNGTPVEYDFIGTGFHVGSGYIVTNKHVVQPWSEDDLVKQMMRENSGTARIKRLVVYFPNFPQPFPLKIQQVSPREDLGVGTIDPNTVSPDIPVLPLEPNNDSAAIGKTVVAMGYPNGPDRLLAMLDDNEAKEVSARFGNSRQNLLNFLAQSRKIQPLTTQGAITDLDSRRVVHDAKTAEGGSGAPLFGQSGKVIGVNFGVFTENTAANMAVPIKFAIDLLHRVGWKSAEELEKEKEKQQQINQVASNNGEANTNTNTQQKP
jgi:hypothetical protein